MGTGTCPDRIPAPAPARFRALPNMPGTVRAAPVLVRAVVPASDPGEGRAPDPVPAVVIGAGLGADAMPRSRRLHVAARTR